MSRRPTRVVGPAAAAALALLTLTACGAGDPDRSNGAQEAVTTTTTPAPDDEGADITLTGTPIEPSALDDVISGALRGSTTATVGLTTDGSLGLDATGVVDLGATPPAAALRLGPQQLLLVDGVAYSRTGGGDYARTEAFASPLAGLLGLVLDRDVVRRVLAAAVTSAADAGTEQRDGESVTRYQALVDTARLAAAAEAAKVPGQHGSALGAGLVPDVVRLDLLVDGAGLLRRVEVGLGPTLGTVTVTFDDWGDPVDIAAPPRGEISTLPTR